MSDSLIAFQPAIEETVEHQALRENIVVDDARVEVTCCHFPRGSVKRSRRIHVVVLD